MFVLVNPVEYHGPHLSLYNDRLISIGLMNDLFARLSRDRPDWRLLIGADLELGVTPAPGPGSRHTSYRIVRTLVLETTRALLELGATRFVFITFHGAPLHSLALEAGVRAVFAAGGRAVSPMHALLAQTIALDDPTSYAPAVAHIEDPATRTRLLASLPTDFHAGFFETSLALHYAPESVSPRHLQIPPLPPVAPNLLLRCMARAAGWLGRPALARELRFAAVGQGWGAMRPFYGYTSEPAHADARAGRYFATQISDLFFDEVSAVLDCNRPPMPPVMGWVGALTLGGRIEFERPSLDEIAAPP